MPVSVSLMEPPYSTPDEWGQLLGARKKLLSTPCDSILLTQRKANDMLFQKSPKSAASSSREEGSIVIHLQQSCSI